jgi:hypothetical protein
MDRHLVPHLVAVDLHGGGAVGALVVARLTEKFDVWMSAAVTPAAFTAAMTAAVSGLFWASASPAVRATLSTPDGDGGDVGRGESDALAITVICRARRGSQAGMSPAAGPRSR